MAEVFDLIGALFILIGALLCLGAAIALRRFPDVLTKMHAITKPQVLGIIAVTLGVAFSLRTWWAAGLCLLIVVLQLLTAPVSATMVARSASRSGLIDDAGLKVNHLTEDLRDAGYSRPDRDA
ncbi:monovalent cation/H(+) antiporter subunit G [Tessaracoccus defluvii]|uniref:Monovalent cation/H(+) antiporter subunit G n=1 Tax=Tessaracoccus defluvii TaxID=1285901 RepID=A0A7H0H3T0_9ACTN|nr:monovalent cation/H(+) antiporter subunit G [Tessaracoccus defluvii]QNP55196.1 monovalent cation/H(+) antiporter subunit G [Tessaracoccus defluvii]